MKRGQSSYQALSGEPTLKSKSKPFSNIKPRHAEKRLAETAAAAAAAAVGVNREDPQKRTPERSTRAVVPSRERVSLPRKASSAVTSLCPQLPSTPTLPKLCGSCNGSTK